MEALMEKEISAALQSVLFAGVKEDEIRSMLKCLSAKKKKYKKGEFILLYGDSIRSIGLLVSGTVNVIKEDYWGNSNIVAAILPGETFADAYACSPDHTLGVSVVAARDCEVLFLEVDRVLHVCSSACSFHSRLIQNLVMLLASKDLAMNEKLTHLTQRTTREKLLSYLSAQAMHQDRSSSHADDDDERMDDDSEEEVSGSFEIPFDRQQLADYLSVDRSALSAELSRMARDGILEYKKNRFRLLKEV
jgi:CRP-like cAMP-binding protein